MRDAREQDVPAGSSRRAVLAVGATGAVGAVGALAGCQVYGGESGNDPPPAAGDGDGAAGTVIASTDEVEVGGGLIVAAQGVVVTQPTEGDFRGFSATCTHQGCIVAEISEGTINCACHGSRFSIEDGSVVQAAQGLSPDQQSPLPEAGITVNGDAIELG